MSADLPIWQPFDAGEGAVPEAIVTLAAGGGDPQIIALLMMPGIDGRWGAEAAVGIARAWGETGHSVLLCDLNLSEPRLHDVLGHENGQGVSDILLYGVSVQHATFASQMGSFLVATAGTPVADPEVVLAHPRWEAVTRGLRDSGVSVLLHLPSDLPGASSLLARADHVVVLTPDASGAEGLGGAIAVLGPPLEEPAEVASEFGVDEPVEAIDVAEDIADAVIEAVTDERDEATDDAVEMPEAATEEAPEPLADTDSPDEPQAEEAAVVEEPSHEAAEDGFGDFSLQEPETPEEEPEVDGGDFSFDAVGGGQYTHTDDGPGEEESSAFDTTGLDEVVLEDPPVEVTPLEGLETMSEEGGPADGEAGGSSDDQEPSFDIGDGLELEAPEPPVDSPPVDPESDPVAADAAVEGLEPRGGVFEVERSSLADDMVAPTGSTMMSGVEHGAGVAEQLPPAPTEFEDDDLGVTDAAPVETSAVAEPVSEAYASDELGEDTDQVEADGGLQIQTERKMSGLDELERRRKWRERRRVLLTAVAATVILGGGGYGLAFLGVVDVPGITPANRMSGAVPAPVQLDGPQPTTPIVSHSLLINSYRTQATPQGLVPTLAERLPGILFFYTPLEVDERVQYVLFAGAAYSAVQADSLKEVLSVVLDRQNPDDWLVRPMPYAFFFGEYDGAARVAARIEDLAALSIPSYALRVDYADGRTALRIYGGAFANEFDARPMAAVISESGMPDVPLIERRGRLPE